MYKHTSETGVFFHSSFTVLLSITLPVGNYRVVCRSVINVTAVNRGPHTHAGMLLPIRKWRSLCSRVVWLPIGVVCCPGIHPCRNCTLDISPCVGKFKRSVWPTAPLYSVLYASGGVWNTWQRNTGHLDHTDWNTSYLDHVNTTQGTLITVTGKQVNWLTWLQHKPPGSHSLEHKALVSQWLEQSMLGWCDCNSRHINHNDWNGLYLDHVTETHIIRYPVIFNMNHLDDAEYFLKSW